MSYEVKWFELSKYMTRQLFIIISIGFTLILLVRYFASGFSVETTFEHISIAQIPLVYLAIFGFSVVFAFLIGGLLTCAKVTINDGIISGRNYWFYKRTFPLNEIETVFPFNSNGMPVVVVDAGKKGQIYVPVHIHHADDIFKILDEYVPRT